MSLSRYAVAFCLLLIFFSAVRADYNTLIQHYRAGKIDSAIVEAQALLVESPESGHYMYWLADLYSLQNQPDSSALWLERAAEHGFTEYIAILHDRDFDNALRSDRFRRAVENVKIKLLAENQQKALRLQVNRFKPLVLNAESPRVEIDLGFDRSALLIRARVTGDTMDDGNRSWRYGDGFFVNLVTPSVPDSGYSDKFYAYGFSMQKGSPLAVLVNHDGTYSLQRLPDLTPKIAVTQNRVDYEITIPWSALYPFHPLLDQTLGLNIVYTSQDSLRQRHRYMLVDDMTYDTESHNLRRYVPMTFAWEPAQALNLAARLDHRLVTRDSLHLGCILDSPVEQQVMGRIHLADTTLNPMSTQSRVFDLHPGLNSQRLTLPLARLHGAGQIRLQLDSLVWQDAFYALQPNELDAIQSVIQDLPMQSALYIQAKNTLQFLANRVQSVIRHYSNRQDPALIHKAMQDLTRALQRQQEKGSLFNTSGYQLAAVMSSQDSTLQPYSLYLPDGFDPDIAFPLIVALHGSGVDEVRFCQSAGHRFAPHPAIILAPRGRDLSAWYMGQTEQDVVDAIQAIKSMFNISETLLYGFSMGGYGAWRMAFLHSGLFEGAMIISGTPIPGRNAIPENRMTELVGHGKDIRYLVIHGTDDRAVPIEETDAFVDELLQHGYRIEYHRVKGGGHGNFSTQEKVMDWLKQGHHP